MPVFGTIASKFNDDGITAFYHGLLDLIEDTKQIQYKSCLPKTGKKASSSQTIIIPGDRVRYLSEIADTIRGYHETTQIQAKAVRNRAHLMYTLEVFENKDELSSQTLLAELKKSRG